MTLALHARGPQFKPGTEYIGADKNFLSLFFYCRYDFAYVLDSRCALLAQWLERAAVNRKVTGSIPVGSVFESLAAAKASKNGKIIWFFNIWQAIYIVLVGFMCTPV